MTGHKAMVNEKRKNFNLPNLCQKQLCIIWWRVRRRPNLNEHVEASFKHIFLSEAFKRKAHAKFNDWAVTFQMSDETLNKKFGDGIVSLFLNKRVVRCQH